MTDQLMEMMKAFHEKFGFETNRLELVPENHVTQINDTRLTTIGTLLRDCADGLLDEAIDQQKEGDSRLYRMHLLLEELGELADAMGRRQIAKTADALGDLAYVLWGSAYTLEMPMLELVTEIHRSNMTKSRAPRNERMRVKGPEYSPPNIAGVLKKLDEPVDDGSWDLLA